MILVIEGRLERCECFGEFDKGVLYVKRLSDGRMFFTGGKL
jgi:hypothetical protein